MIRKDCKNLNKYPTYEDGKLIYTYDCKVIDEDNLKCDMKCDKFMEDVNDIKPSHYNSGKYDVIWFCHYHNLSFDIGNIIKYVFRAGKKDKSKEIQDLKKSIEYIERRIEWIESQGEAKDN